MEDVVYLGDRSVRSATNKILRATKANKAGLAARTSISIIMRNQIHFWRIYARCGWEHGRAPLQSRMNLSQEIGILFFASPHRVSRSDNLIRPPPPRDIVITLAGHCSACDKTELLLFIPGLRLSFMPPGGRSMRRLMSIARFRPLGNCTYSHPLWWIRKVLVWIAPILNN